MTDPSLFKGSYLVFDEDGRPTGQAGGSTGAMDALAQIQRELGKENPMSTSDQLRPEVARLQGIARQQGLDETETNEFVRSLLGGEIAHTAELPPQDLSDDEINELTARAARKRAERRLDQN